VFAPATRVGYLLYPVDFFAWGMMLSAADRMGADEAEVGVGAGLLVPPGQVASGIS